MPLGGLNNSSVAIYEQCNLLLMRAQGVLFAAGLCGKQVTRCRFIFLNQCTLLLSQALLSPQLQWT